MSNPFSGWLSTFSTPVNSPAASGNSSPGNSSGSSSPGDFRGGPPSGLGGAPLSPTPVGPHSGLGGAPLSPTPVNPVISGFSQKILNEVNEVIGEYRPLINIELEKVLSKLKVDIPKVNDLIERAKTPCVHGYLANVITSLRQKPSAIKAASGEFTEGTDRDTFKSDAERGNHAAIIGIAELLGQGFNVVLKDNLVFGEPIGVKDRDQIRFPGCHEYLTQKHARGLAAAQQPSSAGKRRKTKKHQKKKRRTLRRRKLHR